MTDGHPTDSWDETGFMRPHLAHRGFGQLAADVVRMAQSTRAQESRDLTPLGHRLIRWLRRGGMGAYDIRAYDAMSKMAMRKMGVSGAGTAREEQLWLEALQILVLWISEDRNERLERLGERIIEAGKSYTGPGVGQWPSSKAEPGPVKWTRVKGEELFPPAWMLDDPASIPYPLGEASSPMTTAAPVTTEPEMTTPAPTPAPMTRKPTSGWKFIPVREGEPDAHTYTYAMPEMRSPEGMPIVAARVRGKKHKHEGTHCDDWVEAATAGKWTIMAVADGAGSCRFSRVGAKAACRNSVAVLKEALGALELETLEPTDWARDPATNRFKGEKLNIAAEAIHKAMRTSYDELNKATEARKTPDYDMVLSRPIEPRDLSCTLLLTVHVPVMIGGKKYDWVMGCQIGDGMIAAVSKSGTLTLLATPDTGAFSGETEFITSRNKLESSALWGRTQAVPTDLRALMAMTDGVADDYFPNDPGMLTLFGDLCLNGVIVFPEAEGEATGQTGVAESAFSSLSERMVAPDEAMDVRVYSMAAYAKAVGKPVSVILKERHELLTAGAGISYAGQQASSARRLETWLDSYQVRGSFDDRALAVMYAQTTRDTQ
jgi:hypothetical protein